MAITSFSKLITPRQPLLTPYTYRDNRFHKVHITFHRVQLDETFIGGKIKTAPPIIRLRIIMTTANISFPKNTTT